MSVLVRDLREGGDYGFFVEITEAIHGRMSRVMSAILLTDLFDFSVRPSLDSGRPGMSNSDKAVLGWVISYGTCKRSFYVS